MDKLQRKRANVFKELTPTYEYLLKVDDEEFFDNYEEKLKNHVLTPTQINEFFKSTEEFKKYHNHEWHTAWVINELVQNSYNADFNNFFIDTSKVGPIHFLGSELKGKKDNLLNITVPTSTSDGWGQRIENCLFTIKIDNGYESFAEAKNSTINILKNHSIDSFRDTHNINLNIKQNYARNALERVSNSNVSINYNYGDLLGKHASYTKFKIENNSGEEIGLGADNCVFKSENKEVLESIVADPNPIMENNLYLIKDEKEVLYNRED